MTRPLLAAALLLAAACGTRGGGVPVSKEGGDTVPALKVTSAAFSEGGAIPARFTCDGGDASPPLLVEGAPEGTRSFALIMDDPDAPVGTWVHWVLWNRGDPSLPEALPTDAALPDAARPDASEGAEPHSRLRPAACRFLTNTHPAQAAALPASTPAIAWA